MNLTRVALVGFVVAMIPEAVRSTHAFTGLLATAGFLLSYAIHVLG